MMTKRRRRGSMKRRFLYHRFPEFASRKKSVKMTEFNKVIFLKISLTVPDGEKRFFYRKKAKKKS